MMRRSETGSVVRRRGRPTAAAESGFTLVELLVAMTILTVVMTALVAGVMSIQRATSSVDVRTDNVNNARLAIAALSRDLRAATDGPGTQPAFIIAEPRRARFYALLGESNTRTPVRIDLRIDDDDRLVETLTTPTVNPTTGAVTYQPADERERYVASFVHNADDEPLLSYYQLGADAEPIHLGDVVTGDDRANIQLVRFDLRIARDREMRNVAQQVTTEVRLPNRRGQ